MIEINIKNEITSIINKEIIINKFAKTCNELGFPVSRYVLTEYFEGGKPSGYRIELFNE